MWVLPRLVGCLVRQRAKGAAAGAAPKVPQGPSTGAKQADPFCTCPSIGNQVDGLPIALSKDAVPASCRFFGRAPIRKL